MSLQESETRPTSSSSITKASASLLEFLMASQQAQASEARLQAAQKELKADLQAAQQELKVVLQAAQQASETRLQAGQKELKKDLHEIIKL